MDVKIAISQSIAEQLYERIKGKGMLMRGISTRTGIGIESLSRYVNGKRDIPTPAFALICEDINLDGGEVLRKALCASERAKSTTV